jgi:hypothetical protein
VAQQTSEVECELEVFIVQWQASGRERYGRQHFSTELGTHPENVGSVPFVREAGHRAWASDQFPNHDTPPAVAGVRPEKLASVDVYGPLGAGTRPF